MEENLVGYLIGALDSDVHREVEKYLDDEPGARDRLEVLRRAMAPLEADKDTIDPPPGLAIRTLASVAEFRCRPLPAAPPQPARLAVGGRSWWRRGDVLAAACLFVVVGGLGTTWVGHSRAESRKKECEANLHEWHTAITQYATNNGGSEERNELPHLNPRNPRHVAAAFPALLRNNSELPQKLSLRCPANGPRSQDVLPFRDLEPMPEDQFQEQVKKLPGCYAYSLGFYHNGQHRVFREPSDLRSSSAVPIMGDCPSISGEGGRVRGNSKNHNGQNVLFLDGSVHFCKTPYNPFNDKDHLYLNNAGKVAAGVDQWDTVLGCGLDKPGD
jgi:prepilin-type processing-associated H-X9-DG protein